MMKDIKWEGKKREKKKDISYHVMSCVLCCIVHNTDAREPFHCQWAGMEIWSPQTPLEPVLHYEQYLQPMDHGSWVMIPEARKKDGASNIELK